MIMKRRNGGETTAKTGYYRIQGKGSQFLHGFGDGDFIRLRDENGREWRGVAEVSDNLVRFRFRDSEGNYISGVSNSGSDIVLRDEKGNTWRGFVD
jgi:hypothetical protein